MSIVFACAVSHAPGLSAWTERATPAQQQALFGGFETLRAKLAAARPDHLIVLTSEHWTNFFLDHISPYVIGRAESYDGPVEPWLRVEKKQIPADPAFANALIEACYANEFEPGFAQELHFDHGTFLPLHYLAPEMSIPVTPIYFNTLVAPQPSPKRALAFGKVIGEVAANSAKRVAIIATGGMSHDPGERKHGTIYEDFDRAFLDQMARGDLEALGGYSSADLGAKGAGAFELLAWIALAGALQKFRGDVIAYEPVTAWATGMGLIALEQTPA